MPPKDLVLLDKQNLLNGMWARNLGETQVNDTTRTKRGSTNFLVLPVFCQGTSNSDICRPKAQPNEVEYRILLQHFYWNTDERKHLSVPSVCLALIATGTVDDHTPEPGTNVGSNQIRPTHG